MKLVMLHRVTVGWQTQQYCTAVLVTTGRIDPINIDCFEVDR